MSYEELPYLLRLLRVSRIGPVTFFHLIKRFGSAKEALNYLEHHSQKKYLDQHKKDMIIPLMQEIEEEIEKTHAFGAEFVTVNDSFYPILLKKIHDAPPVLIVKGDKNLLKKSCFGIVGSRVASIGGKKLTYQLAQALGQKNMVIVSGLARGIDTSAHEGGFETGTIAMIAGGIDQVYPQENASLFKKIGEQGLLVTENPFGQEPQAHLFLRRNRLIAGISWGVMIDKSGSLNTAEHAIEYNRQLFAIPGHPLDARAYGCNRLIQNGAILVQDIQDIMMHSHVSYAEDTRIDRENIHYGTLFEDTESYEGDYKTKTSETSISNDIILDNKILSILDTIHPMGIDEMIVLLFPYSISSVRSQLMILELENLVLKDSYGDRYYKIDPDVTVLDDKTSYWIKEAAGV